MRLKTDGLPKVGYWSTCERWVYVTFAGMAQPRPFRVENDEIRHDGKRYRVGACHCFPIEDEQCDQLREEAGAGGEYPRQNLSCFI